jgi:hypothetical protein
MTTGNSDGVTVEAINGGSGDDQSVPGGTKLQTASPDTNTSSVAMQRCFFAYAVLQGCNVQVEVCNQISSHFLPSRHVYVHIDSLPVRFVINFAGHERRAL